MCARDKTKLLWIVKMYHAAFHTASMMMRISAARSQLNIFFQNPPPKNLGGFGKNMSYTA